jgi:hypothetical protein
MLHLGRMDWFLSSVFSFFALFVVSQLRYTAFFAHHFGNLSDRLRSHWFPAIRFVRWKESKIIAGKG